MTNLSQLQNVRHVTRTPRPNTHLAYLLTLGTSAVLDWSSSQGHPQHLILIRPPMPSVKFPYNPTRADTYIHLNTLLYSKLRPRPRVCNSKVINWIRLLTSAPSQRATAPHGLISPYRLMTTAFMTAFMSVRTIFKRPTILQV